jgi:hypothetical protein
LQELLLLLLLRLPQCYAQLQQHHQLQPHECCL